MIVTWMRMTVGELETRVRKMEGFGLVGVGAVGIAGGAGGLLQWQ